MLIDLCAADQLASKIQRNVSVNLISISQGNKDIIECSSISGEL